MRQIVLDTETTGILPQRGHRIIEIGLVELIDGKPTGVTLEAKLDPCRDIDPGASRVNGILRAETIGRPLFHSVAADLLDNWIAGSELIVHNAPFDIGFLDAELCRLGQDWGQISHYARRITCTRQLARLHLPGTRHSLDLLADHFGIDRSHRQIHGALKDALLLTQVYQRLMGAQ